MRSSIFLILAIILPFAINAQIVQKGIVKEYNEKAQKTPLSGVELNIRSANTTVSDKNGDFLLSFLTLKPGEKVNVRRIEKLGYEVFNKDAIEQWNLNPTNAFVIVMCKSDKFKRIRDNYERVSSESYARQLKKEEAALAKLKEEGKLKEEEYQRQLYNLREEYENQLDNLDTYIDRFSRIDLSELSAIEQEIIELVQAGRIEEAIAKYEEQDYVNKFKEESANILEISQAIDKLDDLKFEKMQSCDSLLTRIKRYINVLTLSGGQESLSKAAQIYMDIANCDTTNASWQLQTSEFLANNISDYKKSLEYASRAVRLTNKEKSNILAAALSNYSTVMYRLSDYSTAKIYIEKAIDIYECQESPDIDNLSTVYHKLGNICTQLGEYENALKRYNQSMDVLSDNGIVDSIAISYAYNSMGSVYDQLGQYEEAYKYMKKALNIRMNNCQDNKSLIAASCGNLGSIEMQLGHYESALQYSQNALDIYKQLYGLNHFEVAESYVGIARIYADLDDFDKALEYYNKALAVEKGMFYEVDIHLAQLYNNIAATYNQKGEYAKALELYQSTLKIHQTILGENHSDTANTYNNIGYTYAKMNEREKALEYYFKALELYLSLFGENNPKVGDVTNNIGSTYFYIGDMQNALKYLESTLNNRIVAFGENHPLTALALNNVATVYDNLNEKQKAIDCYLRSLAVCKNIYGEDHSTLATVYDNLAQLYYGTGNFAATLEMGETALRIREKVYGDNHSTVAISYNNMGHYCFKAQEYQQSIDYLSKAKRIHANNGNISGATDAAYMMGRAYKEIGKLDKMSTMFNEAISIREDALGKSHPDVAKLKMQIGEAYYNLMDYNTAISLFSESGDILKNHNANLFNYLIQMIYFSYTKSMTDNESMIDDFNKFMSDKVFIGKVSDENCPAGKLGLSGEYYIFEFDDWNLNSTKNLFERIQGLRGCPKDVSLASDGEICSYHFDDAIGMNFILQQIDPEVKKSLITKYQNWKTK